MANRAPSAVTRAANIGLCLRGRQGCTDKRHKLIWHELKAHAATASVLAVIRKHSAVLDDLVIAQGWLGLCLGCGIRVVYRGLGKCG